MRLRVVEWLNKGWMRSIREKPYIPISPTIVCDELGSTGEIPSPLPNDKGQHQSTVRCVFGAVIEMNKIIKAIGAFLAMMMIITPVMGYDHFGREYENINGDIYYYNQTVYIGGIYGACGGFETFENCTIKIATSGEITFDGKKAPYYQMKYASSCWYQGMGWNNFPAYGEEFEDIEFTLLKFETSGEAGMYMCVATIKGAHNPAEFMIVKAGTWNKHDVRAHAEANGIAHVTVLEYQE